MNSRIFLPRNKTLKTFFTSMIIYILLFFFFKNDLTCVSFSIRIIYIILSFILFMMLSKANGVIDEYVYVNIRNFLIIISIIGFLGISIITDGYSLASKNNYICISTYVIIFMETVLNYILKDYNINKHIHKNLAYGAGIFSVVIMAACMKFLYYTEVFLILKILCVVMQIILCMHIYRSIKIYEQLYDRQFKINWRYIYSLIVCVSECANMISDKFDVTYILIENAAFFNFLIIFEIVIINQIEEPYEYLINILRKESEELDELNMQIIMKNTELEKLNMILQQKEELNHTFFRFMPHPIVILNAANNRITFVNNKFLELAEVGTAREIINQKIKKYIEFTAYSEENDFDAVLHIGSKKKYLKTKFLTNYSSDDRKLILLEDNTAKVQIREMRNEVEKRKRHEYIRTQFLSSISHDLKTPINVIYSGLQLEQIYIDKGDIKSLKKYNEISRQNCISLIKFTNNLIDNSKISSHFLSANLIRINIVEVIEEQVMSYVDYAMWNGIELIFDTNTEECMMDIDVEFMRRIILNLISNSVKYTPKQGKIFVVIEENPHNVFIKVKDTGCGIKKELRDKIFCRYTSSNKAVADSKSGTGLGLFVVKRLVELQNGTIHLGNEEEIGTSIVIEFKKGEIYA